MHALKISAMATSDCYGFSSPDGRVELRVVANHARNWAETFFSERLMWSDSHLATHVSCKTS